MLTIQQTLKAYKLDLDTPGNLYLYSLKKQVKPEISKEVKKSLGDIIGALQKRELKTDVLTKENK